MLCQTQFKGKSCCGGTVCGEGKYFLAVFKIVAQFCSGVGKVTCLNAKRRYLSMYLKLRMKLMELELVLDVH